MNSNIPQSTSAEITGTLQLARQRIKKRKALDRLLFLSGLGALAIAVSVLIILIGSLVATGHSAFIQTYITLDLDISERYVKREDPFKGQYRNIINEALLQQFPGVTERSAQRQLFSLPSPAAQYMLRDHIASNPKLIGNTIRFAIPVSDPYDQLNKGLVLRETEEQNRRLKQQQINWFDTLDHRGLISNKFNWNLLTNPDSRFPEVAGLAGAIMGSLYTLLICFAVSFPVGIGAAIHLELFAPKNRFTDLIEININNLAAVPSIVFGLLALAVFLNSFGMPRSTPLVGGLTLALMTLPTIIIATRSALKSVPTSIHDAALALGASRQQAVFHHILPAAMPGILTGAIIGMAQALGETAPLLLIGMNAFLAAVPNTPIDASTTLPTQIFLWADSPERGFISRTCAAILVLLGLLVSMNAIAIFLRQKLEKQH